MVLILRQVDNTNSRTNIEVDGIDSRKNNGKISIEETEKTGLKVQAHKEKIRRKQVSSRWLNIHWRQRNNICVLTRKTFMRYHKLK